jgi:undecaprenyl-diphosphatase
LGVYFAFISGLWKLFMSMKALLELDARWSRQVRLDPQRRGLFTVAAFLAHSGDSWFWMIGLGLIWLFTLGNTALKSWHVSAALLAAGVFVLAFLVLAIKFSIRRQRPAGDWGAIYRNTDPHSFPSGHAARAAMLAVMALGLGPAWFGWLVLAWAPLVSLARVVTGVHYLSDIIAGLLLGALAGFAMLSLAPLLMQVFPFMF